MLFLYFCFMQSAQEKIQADLKQSKEKLKVFLKNINNSQFQDLNYSIKINIILNCFDDIFIQKFKSIPDVFNKQQTNDTLTNDEIELLNDEIELLDHFITLIEENYTGIQSNINNNINNLIDKIYLPIIKELIATNKFLTTLCQISEENDINKITILDIYKCKQFFLTSITKFKQSKKISNQDLNKCIDLMQTPTSLRNYCIFLTTLSNITNSNTDIS